MARSTCTTSGSPGPAKLIRVETLLAVMLVMLVMLVLTTGCQRALFPADSPRTQFELQDRMRGHYVPLEEPDVFGRPQPALRARLTRHD